jgi:hypothetical protein
MLEMHHIRSFLIEGANKLLLHERVAESGEKDAQGSDFAREDPLYLHTF